METVRLVLRDDQWAKMELHCLGKARDVARLQWVMPVETLFQRVEWGRPNVAEDDADSPMARIVSESW